MERARVFQQTPVLNSDLKFKKYFQRITNETGAEYREWIGLIECYKNELHDVCILGHSLDLSDHEIVKEFFNLSKNLRIRIVIAYHDEQSKIKF